MTPLELSIVRRAYAKHVLATAGVSDLRLEGAFAEVKREDFLGTGPWQMLRLTRGYGATPDDDPVYLYMDQVVGLVPARRINNGQPSLHAMLIAAARIAEGEHIVHVGAGTGYYSAIMAQLAGAAGRVTAIECDPELAARARECLRTCPTATLLQTDGAATPIDSADVIYVNAGVTHPANVWLDALREGGRLIIPLTADANFPTAPAAFDMAKAMRSGVYFLIQRRGETFEVRGLLPTMIIPAQGAARDAESEAALAAALEKGGWNRVTRLVRGDPAQGAPYWLQGRGWYLSCD